MNWIFFAQVGAAILHVVEEYAYPGGFPAFMKKMVPPLAPFISANFAIAINGLFLLLCFAAALVDRSAQIFRLSIAGLCGLNGLTHIAGAIRARKYAPGLLTGALLYLPLAILALARYASAGQVSVGQIVGSFLFGILYQVIPVGYLGLAYVLKRR